MVLVPDVLISKFFCGQVLLMALCLSFDLVYLDHM